MGFPGVVRRTPGGDSLGLVIEGTVVTPTGREEQAEGQTWREVKVPDGRLGSAQDEGRLGVARSMRGRVRDLGGVIVCDTGPERGTEWIITLPRKVSR